MPKHLAQMALELASLIAPYQMRVRSSIKALLVQLPTTLPITGVRLSWAICPEVHVRYTDADQRVGPSCSSLDYDLQIECVTYGPQSCDWAISVGENSQRYTIPRVHHTALLPCIASLIPTHLPVYARPVMVSPPMSHPPQLLRACPTDAWMGTYGNDSIEFSRQPYIQRGAPE